jgi:hypothetical protein
MLTSRATEAGIWMSRSPKAPRAARPKKVEDELNQHVTKVGRCGPKRSWYAPVPECSESALRGQNLACLRPSLAIGDGALGFWKAMRQVWSTTREQRCWVHTIRAQAIDRGAGTGLARGHTSERDHMTNLQRTLTHDHALDQQLQDLLLLNQRRPIQSGANPITERLQVRQQRLGIRRVLT